MMNKKRRNYFKKFMLGALLTVAVGACSVGVGVKLSAENAQPASASENTVRPIDLFEENDQIVYKNNAETPDYFFNGYLTARYHALLVEDGVVSADQPESAGTQVVPDYMASGLKVTFKAGKSPAVYKPIVDISEYDSTTPLMVIAPIAKTRGVRDVNTFTVKLQDADNEERFVSFVFTYNAGRPLDVGVAGATNKIRQQCDGGTYTGIRYYGPGLCNNSTGGKLDKDGVTRSGEDIICSPYAICFDNATSRLYVQNIYTGSTTQVLNLLNEDGVGLGNAFEGFTNNRVKISIQVDSLLNAEADFMIFELMGNKLGTDCLTDDKAPLLKFNLPQDNGESVIPKAKVGTPYDIFECLAFDELTGESQLEISIKEPGAKNFRVISGKSFTPDHAGTYVLRYKTEDVFGNTRTKEYEILARSAMEQMIITPEALEKTEYLTGDVVEIPSFSVFKGAGAITASVRVVRLADNSELSVSEDNTFTVTAPGQYAICYDAIDYVGQTASKSVLLSATAKYTPTIVGELNVPAVLIDGVKTLLPTVTAWDYDSYPGAKVKVDPKITITSDKLSAPYTVPANRVFLPDVETFGENITIKYSYESLVYKTSPAWERSYNCKIRKAEYALDYFDYDESKIIGSYNPDNSSRYVRFVAKASCEEATFSFVNPVTALNAAVDFEIEYGYQSFDSIKFTFSDSQDSSVRFDVYLSPVRDKNGVVNTEQSVLTYLSNSYTVSGGFNGEDNKVNKPLRIAFVDGAIQDFNNKTYFYVDKNFDGTAFKGFTSGYVKIDVTIINPVVEEGAGAAVKISKIRNQNFYARYKTDGTMRAFEDTVTPNVVYSFDSSKAYMIGDKITVPMAYAADELSSYMEVFVSVKAPNGDSVIEKQPIKDGLFFNVEEYGRYSIIYTTEDANGLVCDNAYLNINIMDRVAPTVTLLSNKAIEAKVGESVKIPEVIVQDNYSENVTLEVLVKDQTGRFFTVKDNTYTPTSEGTHTIVYCAIDENFNLTYAELKIIVKGA